MSLQVRQKAGPDRGGSAMPIIVNTSGPNNSIPALLAAQDRNFFDMMVVIADEIDDTHGEYMPQIQNCIFAAIRFCQREIYYFNESNDVTFATLAGREWYDGRDNAHIATLIRIRSAWCESGRQRFPLNRCTAMDYELLPGRPDASGMPAHYCYFGQRLRLQPIPDRSYLIRLQVGPFRLADIQTSTDSNAWFTEAFDMVKARAKYQLYKDFLKDAALAAAALADFNEEQQALAAETSRRNGHGRIRPMEF